MTDSVIKTRYLRCRWLTRLLDRLNFSSTIERTRQHLISFRLSRWVNRGDERRSELRRFGEYYLTRKCQFIPNVQLYHDNTEDGPPSYWMFHFQWLWFSFYQHFGWSKKKVINKTQRDGKWVECPSYEGCSPSWGITTLDENAHLHWGYRSRIWGLPFISFHWKKTELLSLDQKTILTSERGRWDSPERQAYDEQVKEASATYPYRYVNTDGVIQDVTATVHVTRMTWRRKWLPLHMRRTSTNVTFSEGIGGRRDSWKGGCIGCSYEMKPGEKALDTLRRMEKERRFN